MGTIQFINHASFLLDYKGVRLICDPWLVGSAFQDGWDLLTPVEKPVDFSTITHIWFSHEHPDHFSVPSIKSIPAEVRPNITVLFQTTKDKKVINFCAKQGFKVQELPLGKNFSLTPEITLTCDKEGIEDSWLFIDTPDFKILNLNDCVVDTKYRIRKVNQALNGRHPDILFSQFGYANKIGEEDDIEERLEESRHHTERLALQCGIFHPKIIVPFASYIYFSRTDNFYMNSGMNDVAGVENFLHQYTQARPLVLKPLQIIDIAQILQAKDIDNRDAVSFYHAAASRIAPKPVTSGDITIQVLEKAAEDYKTRLKNYHLIQKILHTIFPHIFRDRIVFHVTDLDQYFAFDWSEKSSPCGAEDSHIRISAETLKFLFDFDYGVGTLSINGRYTNHNLPSRVFRYSFIFGNWRNNGELIPLSYLADRFVEKITGARKIFEG
ncbi:MAG TPA: MBL fold metallo-hydrolase [Alphaproteobacteria bacterium]